MVDSAALKIMVEKLGITKDRAVDVEWLTRAAKLVGRAEVLVIGNHLETTVSVHDLLEISQRWLKLETDKHVAN